jgi:hypothetical protein
VNATCRNCGGPVNRHKGRHRPYRYYVCAVCNERTLDPVLTYEDPLDSTFAPIAYGFKILCALVLIGTALQLVTHRFYLF